jgi:hypothetical protein
MDDILKKIRDENPEYINNNIIEKINGQIKQWGKNIPSKKTYINNFLEKYKNIHSNDIGIIFFAGPSLNKTSIKSIVEHVKNENPGKNIICYGCSRCYMKTEMLQYLNYYSFGDGYPDPKCNKYKIEIDDFLKKNPNIISFVSSYRDGKVAKGYTEEIISNLPNNATPIDTYGLYEIYKDISKYPMTNHFGGPHMTQIFLYMGIKKIYIVGSDSTKSAVHNRKKGWNIQNHTGYFYNHDDSKQTVDPHYIYWWIRIKQFIEKEYPESEIISINPVGLKGIFKDVIL